ncbi:hypothetical protein H1R20_g15023, partial [Candolleomyces eurysporus]
MPSSASDRASSSPELEELQPANNGQSTAPRPRPKPTKFTNAQKTYLNSHLDVFLAECAHLDKTGAGPCKVKGNKGAKKAWVERKVIPGFVKTFQLAGSDGPELSALSSKIYRWYVNKHKDLVNTTEAKPAKKDPKLKAKSASALFAKDHASEIRARAREKGHTSSGGYLRNYHSVKKEMYDQLDQKDQLAYQTRADASKEALKQKPDASTIYENQRDVVERTGEALQSLTGFDWGGHGQVAYWVVGAYLDENERWKTFKYIPSFILQMEPFTKKIPDEVYSDHIRSPFLSHVKASIKTTNRTKATAAGITFDEGGFPVLSGIDIDAQPPKALLRTLTQYIKCVWESVLPQAYTHVPVPWGSLHTISNDHVASLDLRLLPKKHLYDLYDSIHERQKQGTHGIDLAPSIEFLKTLVSAEPQSDNDIEEIADPKKVARADSNTSLANVGDKVLNGNTAPRSATPGDNDHASVDPTFDVIPVGAIAQFRHCTTPDDDKLDRHHAQAAPSPSTSNDSRSLGDEEEWGGAGIDDGEEWLGAGIAGDFGIDNNGFGDAEVDNEKLAGALDQSEAGDTINDDTLSSLSSLDDNDLEDQATIMSNEKVGTKRKSHRADESSRQRSKRSTRLPKDETLAPPPRRSTRQQSAGADQHSELNPDRLEVITGTGAWKRFTFTAIDVTTFVDHTYTIHVHGSAGRQWGRVDPEILLLLELNCTIILLTEVTDLPPTIRYNLENVYLVGIIPGPNQPSRQEINHLLKPLIDDFLILWDDSIYLSRTYLHNTGIRVRGAIVPLICDLPASRQMSGYAGFQSNQFCSECTQSLSHINNLDVDSWTQRTWEDHFLKGSQWDKAGTLEEKEALYGKHGIRWSELLRLPYWDPTKYTLIDSMHAFYLRLFQHHIRSIWGMSVKFDDGDGIMFDTSRHHPTEVEMKHGYFVLRHGSDTSLKDLSVHLLREICRDLELDYRGKKKTLVQTLLDYRIRSGWFTRTGQYIRSEENPLAEPPPVSQLENGMTTDECLWTASKSKMKKLKLADLRKVFKEQVLPASAQQPPSSSDFKKYMRDELLKFIRDEMNSAITLRVKALRAKKDTRVLGRETLAQIRSDMQRLDRPSWQPNGPRLPGDEKFGKFTAIQWRTFCIINLPVTLIRLWGNAAKESREKAQLNNFMHLVTVVKLATMNKMTEERIRLYEYHMSLYLRTLLQLYPTAKITPYQHLSMHFGRHLRLFGPVHAWRCFPFECYNHVLQSIPTNMKFGGH